MKRMIFFILGLEVAVISQAAMVISANGDTSPSEVTIEPGGNLVLDIHTTVPIPTVPGGGYLVMAVNSAMGSLSGGVPTQWDPPYYVYPFYYPPLIPNMSAVAFNAFHPDFQEISAGSIFDQILFQGLGTGDADVQLYTTADGVMWTLTDQLIVHTIPEPLTMALLGLGGLFLARGRR